MTNQSTAEEPMGRRARNRLIRHHQMLRAATDIISESGLRGLTMHAVAERVDCAVGTIYTYFPSKDALLQALQVEAFKAIASSIDRSTQVWEEQIRTADLEPATASLVRLVAYGHLFVASPELHPREFELLQAQISSSSSDILGVEDLPGVVPEVIELLWRLHDLIDNAVAMGALATRSSMVERENGQSLRRALRWVAALNGAMLLHNSHGDPDWVVAEHLDGHRLALALSQDLLLAWGADEVMLASANIFVHNLASRDQLLRRGEVVPVDAGVLHGEA